MTSEYTLNEREEAMGIQVAIDPLEGNLGRIAVHCRSASTPTPWRVERGNHKPPGMEQYWDGISVSTKQPPCKRPGEGG